MKVKLLSKVPKHSEALAISRQSQEIENKLNQKLVMLIDSIQNTETNALSANYYWQTLETSFKSAVEEIYRIAAKHATDFAHQEYYTTITDINEIEKLSQDYSNLLFSRIQRNKLIDIYGEKPILTSYIVKFTTANMTQETMRQAIITKSQNILTPNTITTAAEGDIQTVYVWVTSQDDKVCPICSGFEGQAWAFDDTASIPDIPDDTHPNCRCIIQLSEAEIE